MRLGLACRLRAPLAAGTILESYHGLVRRERAAGLGVLRRQCRERKCCCGCVGARALRESKGLDDGLMKEYEVNRVLLGLVAVLSRLTLASMVDLEP